MKKKKTISLKHPRLVGFRNFLREVLTLAVLSELDDGLTNQRDGLRLAWKKSICTCSLCGSRVCDMTLLVNDGYWFCYKCYTQRHDFYKKKAEEGRMWYNGAGRPSTTWFP